MKRIGRLLGYMRPYAMQLVLSVVLMAICCVIIGLSETAEGARRQKE